MATPAVKFIGATKQIRSKTIVDNLTMDINKGEVFGLLGPNGAGKTTTIRMMVGLIAITAGDITVNGWSVSKHFREAISGVGAIVENPEFYPFLSGYRNLVHYANMHPQASRERLYEVITMIGLEARIDDPVRTYSLGMRQRLGIAQALLHYPSVLVLDEPTNGLDPGGIRELRRYLRHLAENEGVTAIVSSHLLSEMELMCDRAAFIKEGKLLDIKAVRNFPRDEWQVFQVDQPQRARVEILKMFPGARVNIDEGAVELMAGRETTAAINAGLVQAGVKIYGIMPKTGRLEDVFMEVTSE